jgi:biotin carboxylase
MRTLLVVGAGPWQVPAIRIGKRLGYRVVATDLDPEATGAAEADAFHPVSTRDLDGTLDVARREEVAGITSIISETATVTVARIARALGLPGMTVDTALAATHKGIMKRTLQEAGLPVAAGTVVTSSQELAAFLTDTPVPCVVKPSDSSGQRGITLMVGGADPATAWEAAARHATDDHVVVEEFLEGREINTTCVARNGEVRVLSISDRITLPPPHLGIAVEHLAPPAITAREAGSVSDLAIASTRAIGLVDGVTYPQMILTESGPVMLEIAARVPGGFMNEVALCLSGIDMVEFQVRVAMGEAPDPGGPGSGSVWPAVGVRFLTRLDVAAEIRTVSAIDGLREAEAIEGVQTVFMDLRPGEEVPPLESSWGRFGAIIAVGETREDVVRVLDDAGSRITIS